MGPSCFAQPALCPWEAGLFAVVAVVTFSPAVCTFVYEAMPKCWVCPGESLADLYEWYKLGQRGKPFQADFHVWSERFLKSFSGVAMCPVFKPDIQLLGWQCYLVIRVSLLTAAWH